MSRVAKDVGNLSRLVLHIRAVSYCAVDARQKVGGYDSGRGSACIQWESQRDNHEMPVVQYKQSYIIELSEATYPVQTTLTCGRAQLTAMALHVSIYTYKYMYVYIYIYIYSGDALASQRPSL